MKDKFSGTAMTVEISLMGYACYFDALYLTFKLSIASCFHVEIHTRLCAFVRGVIIKIGLLNHCTKGDRDGGRRQFQRFWTLHGFIRLQ